MELNKQDVKVLVIDDNPKNLQVAMNILSKEGYSLIYAQSGKKGIELAQKYDISLILLDVLMPNMDGYEVCKVLKSSEKTEDIPVIFLTVKDEEIDMVKGFECGGVDYITKPFSPMILLKRVETHLKLYNYTKDLKKSIQKEVEKARVKDQILFHQAKNASMGEMIANIAHQWRQPLGAISATVMNLKTKLELNGDKECLNLVDKKLSDIGEYVDVLSETIDDFRNFFKPAKEAKEFDIKEIVQKSVKLLTANFKSTHITIEDKTDSIMIESLPNQLSQVLINILNNARDALVEDVDNSDKKITILSSQANDKVFITIKDNAKGIDESVIDRIFEPYFTTKHKSHGTGIGLYMSKEITEKLLGGFIEVDNTPNGASFSIVLPKSYNYIYTQS